VVAADNFSLRERDTVKTQLKKVEQLSISIILVYFSENAFESELFCVYKYS